MDIYRNLQLLLVDGEPLGRGISLTDTPAGIEIRPRAYQGKGNLAVRVTPANIATYYITDANQRTNIVLGQLGLGAVVNHYSVHARLLYWLRARSYVYQPGMAVDLASGVVVGDTGLAIPPGGLAVDADARDALLSLIRAKIPQAVSYLRVAAIPYLQARKTRPVAPVGFIDAVRGNRTAEIATIPVRMLRSWGKHAPSDPLHACYERVLKAYINQNRAALYHAAGILQPKEPL